MEPDDAVKLAFLLSGGGEFAFVVLALAERLEVLPKDLGGLLTAIVLITMAVTPLLGSLADAASKYTSTLFVSNSALIVAVESSEECQVAEDAIVICGYEEVGKEVLLSLVSANLWSDETESTLPQIVVFDTEPSLINNIILPFPNAAVMYGDGENPAVFHSHGVSEPRAIFVSYQEHEQVMAATSRLRTSFVETPIFTRARTREEAVELKCAGATEVIVEADELPRSAPTLLMSDEMEECLFNDDESEEPSSLADLYDIA